MGDIFGKVALAKVPMVSVKSFGAKGDGVNDDTTAISNALNSGTGIYFPAGSYLVTADINAGVNFWLYGQGTLTSDDDTVRIIIADTVTDVGISGLVFDGVSIYNEDRSNGIKLNLNLENFNIQATDIYGVQVSNLGILRVDKCKFYQIGTGTIDTTYQGIGIRINYVDDVFIKDSIFEECGGTGAVVIKYASCLYIYRNKFYKNDYRGIALSNQTSGTTNYDLKTAGIISENIIQECGTYASHETGVGCNGIYGNYGDFNGVNVIHNKIKNVCENGIEGTFGIVEDNDIDGTGVDQVNHPTPSASGINLYGKVYRNNIVKNSYLAAYLVSDNQKLDGTGITDLIVDGNISENSDTSGSSGGAMYVLVPSTTGDYNGVKILNNTLDKPLVINRSAGAYTNLTLGNNYVPGGEFYSGTYNVIANMLDKGELTWTGFAFSNDTTLSNYTVSNATVAKQTETVNSISTFYPLITNADNTSGYFKIVDLAIKQNQRFALDITFKGVTDCKWVYASVAFKDVAGTELNPRVVKTISFGDACLSDFVTKTLIQNIPSGAVSINIVFKINNNGGTGATALSAGYFKDIKLRVMPK